MRLLLVGLVIGISESLETRRDTRAPPRDETIIPSRDGSPVISSNTRALIACLPRSVVSSLKTKIKRVEGAGLHFRGEVNIRLPKMQCRARTPEMTVRIENEDRALGQALQVRSLPDGQGEGMVVAEA